MINVAFSNFSGALRELILSSEPAPGTISNWNGVVRLSASTCVEFFGNTTNCRVTGPFRESPGKVFGLVKPFLVHLHLKTKLKTCIREPLFILRIRK